MNYQIDGARRGKSLGTIRRFEALNDPAALDELNKEIEKPTNRHNDLILLRTEVVIVHQAKPAKKRKVARKYRAATKGDE